MNETLLRIVRTHRSGIVPMPIVHAVRIARYELEPPVGDYGHILGGIEPYACELTGEVDGLTVSVRIVNDEDSQLGDDDVTGVFTDTYTDGCIRNTLSGQNGRSLEWYQPSNSRLHDGLESFDSRGMSKAVAHDTFRRLVEDDMADDAERYWLGVVVEVSYEGSELASESLWGIDVIPSWDAEPHLTEVAAELIDSCLAEVRTNAPRIVAKLRRRADKLEATLSE